MPKTTQPYATAANRYARDVVRGKLAACSYVRQACVRHLDDLERSKSRDYPFRWDRESAERICRFASNMVHVKGREPCGTLHAQKKKFNPPLKLPRAPWPAP